MDPSLTGSQGKGVGWPIPPSQREPLHPNPTARHVQDTQVSESPEGAFRDVADGIVAEAQDAQATEVGQAVLVQPREVVERQNPEEGKGEQRHCPVARGALSSPEH